MSNIKQIIKTKFTNKKIGMLGLGIENFALVKFLLAEKIKCSITVCDWRKDLVSDEKYKYLLNKKNITWKLGKEEAKRLDGFDVIYRSPGWPVADPAIADAVKLGVKLSSAVNLFFRLCPTKNIIGVTGTKGKGTTATLIYKILKAGGKRAYLAGNIGIAPFSFIRRIRKSDWVVLELSSFQLEDIRFSPHIAVITNIYHEHLAPADPHNPNYHKSIKTYWSAKANILRFQDTHDKAIINQRLKNRNLKYGCGKKILFDKSKLKSRLAGGHNKENIAAAVLAAKCAGVSNEKIEKAVLEFKGLEHRLELAKTTNKIKFYNDSFATTPESAIIAIKSFKEPLILIAGGAEKNSNFRALARSIKKKVKYVVLLDGKATPRIKNELLKIKYPSRRIYLADSMESAVRKAWKNAETGNVILLSPACASFGMFNNYKERGKIFKNAVKMIK